jgi:hypothetical protein
LVFSHTKIYVSQLAFYNCKGKCVTKKIALPSNMPDKNAATFKKNYLREGDSVGIIDDMYPYRTA